jgi:hypothetical protein
MLPAKKSPQKICRRFGFIMIVVGSGDFPTGLHVSLNTANSHLRLLPAPKQPGNSS